MSESGPLFSVIHFSVFICIHLLILLVRQFPFLPRCARSASAVLLS